MNLVIVESPTKAKTIGKFLGPDFKVLSSFGHIRDLPKSELGIDTENDFTPKYVIPPKARKAIKALKIEAKKADSIILATDEDREGEAIAWHIAKVLDLDEEKKNQRIVFHEITKTAIEESLKNPRDLNMNLVNAQQTRRILDRIVGYKLSPFLWKKVARGLSAGRVQSVTVLLVVEREKEIQKFVPQEYWDITALLTKKTESLQFEAVLNKKAGKNIGKMDIKDEKEADEIIKDLEKAEYAVTDIEKKEVNRNPLPPFTTSTLQQEAWKKLRFPAKFTMGVAQGLYEKGFITYHRTDSLNLSESALFEAKDFINSQYGKEYWPGSVRKFKTKSKGAQEAHEAIRPTSPNRAPDSIAKDLEKDKQMDAQIKLYDLIWRRFIASQMSQAIFNSTTCDIDAKNYSFRTNGQTLKFDGFLKVYPIKFEEKEIPPLEKGEILNLIELSPNQHFTQPPARYTEASLIKALEENGIGRPSTYAPIISTVQERNYIEKNDQKRFQPTEIGTVVINLLLEHFPQIVDIKFTAKMEEDFDTIAAGGYDLILVLEKFYGPFAKNLKEKYEEVSKKDIAEEKTDKICPKCGSPLIIKLGRFGKFYACSGFPKCEYTESLAEKDLGVACPKCKEGKIVEKRTRKAKIFYGCNRYPKCDQAYWDKPINKNCPKCSSLLVETKSKKIKCSNKECDYSEEK
ncbi:MAG: type I DNA topoisomerase [Candidatus Parcubacteria bacterium]|nr:type I DNA topoisomerase [Candidatus Parcubacteria bacterium]